jgi:simple sugar transport system permease protein
MESAGFYPQTDALPPALRVPRFVSAYRVHLGLTGALLAALATQVLLFRTVIGYELRALGLNVEAARLAGIAVRRNMLLALLVSGALAGIAGGMEVCAVTFRVYERFSPGYGFTAIAVALLGRLHPIGVVLAAVFFGALEAGSNSMQRVAGISSVLVSVIQAAVIFSLLAFERRAWLRAS